MNIEDAENYDLRSPAAVALTLIFSVASQSGEMLRKLSIVFRVCTSLAPDFREEYQTEEGEAYKVFYV